MNEDLEKIRVAFNEFMDQLARGDHRDAMDHRVLMNGKLRELRDAIAGATEGEVVDIEAARARATEIAEAHKAQAAARRGLAG